ncbi:protein-export chaperone SecB [Wenxinia marina]|uniref:Protein-export protein SecB n=1 Tax=Wenxinia marina DSM 24838 TaxID=1123501 RepID=A0A0D0PI47_9RHOB|nr:protein-export chaperone SecB [Wenxinia marina]KIQ71066.1 protein translocase subunit secB [Wenxinia marina DSM 24838]GGL55111.1 protein-export protein SecB [Wenxinia marina]
MTDNPDPTGAGAPAGAEATQSRPTTKVLTQYIRDLSFENGLATKAITGEVKPQIAVQVNLDARRRGNENQYEVITKIKATSKNQGGDETLFVCELEYAGIFQVEGVAQEQLHPYLLIECPRLTFPFVRRILSDVTRDGGFPPLNLDQIDFLEIYKQEIQRRVAAGQGGEGAPANGAATDA